MGFQVVVYDLCLLLRIVAGALIGILSYFLDVFEDLGGVQVQEQCLDRSKVVVLLEEGIAHFFVEGLVNIATFTLFIK